MDPRAPYLLQEYFKRYQKTMETFEKNMFVLMGTYSLNLLTAYALNNVNIFVNKNKIRKNKIQNENDERAYK